MDAPAKRRFSRWTWYLFKLPATYLLIVVGFMFEFLLTLPFRIICALQRSHDRH